MTRRSLCVRATLAAVAIACSTATQLAPPGTSAGEAAGSTGAHAADVRQTPPHTAADVRFMSGMIAHHAQAVLIAGWAPSHGASPSLRVLCARIVVAQQDEIVFMRRWLGERHETAPPDDPPGHDVPGTSHGSRMPGMLTAEELARLDGVGGPEFDRLFLTFMIQHHRGAITMVEQLLRERGAAQDGQVFRFAADVNADQATEIDRMTRMLGAMPLEGARP